MFLYELFRATPIGNVAIGLQYNRYNFFQTITLFLVLIFGESCV